MVGVLVGGEVIVKAGVVVLVGVNVGVMVGVFVMVGVRVIVAVTVGSGVAFARQPAAPIRSVRQIKVSKCRGGVRVIAVMWGFRLLKVDG